MIGYVIGLLVLVLVESSWINFPLLLAGSFLFSEKVGLDKSIVVVAVMGVILDVLALGRVGVSGLLLLAYLVGKYVIEKSFGFEGGGSWWLLLWLLLWKGLRGGLGFWSGLICVGIWLLVLWLNRGSGRGREIKLRG